MFIVIQLIVLQNMFCNPYFRYFNLVLTILVHQDHIRLNISQNSCSWNLCNIFQFLKLPGLPREQLMIPWIPGIASMCNCAMTNLLNWYEIYNILDWNPRQKETNFNTCIATISARSLAAALSRSEALWGEVGERGHLRNHIFPVFAGFSVNKNSEV